SEPASAMLSAAAPLPAPSGKTQRHRLNRGGDRQANSALHLIVITRMRVDQRTKDYVARRIAQGHSKPEIIRCLKRPALPPTLTPRLRADHPPRAYAPRRIAQGHSKPEIIRCLKRYVAREIYYLL